MSPLPQRRAPLGGGAGAAALSAVAASHLFLLPLTGNVLAYTGIVGVIVAGGTMLASIAPRLLRAAAVGGLFIFIRILVVGLPIPAIDAERAPMFDDREVKIGRAHV